MNENGGEQSEHGGEESEARMGRADRAWRRGEESDARRSQHGRKSEPERKEE